MPIDNTEKERRRALVKAHYEVENNHDMDGIVATFSSTGEMLYNRQSFADPDAIRAAHGLIGFTEGDGAFENVHNTIDGEHFTEDEIVIEGHLSGKHVGEFQGFAPTDRTIELPFVAFYRFDGKGELTSERVVMDLSSLAG